jgi:hypothetical protein
VKKLLSYTQAIEIIKYKHFKMPRSSNESFVDRMLKNLFSLFAIEYVECFSILISGLRTV